jgi:hypothetical protein
MIATSQPLEVMRQHVVNLGAEIVDVVVFRQRFFIDLDDRADQHESASPAALAATSAINGRSKRSSMTP